MGSPWLMEFYIKATFNKCGKYPKPHDQGSSSGLRKEQVQWKHCRHLFQPQSLVCPLIPTNSLILLAQPLMSPPLHCVLHLVLKFYLQLHNTWPLFQNTKLCRESANQESMWRNCQRDDTIMPAAKMILLRLISLCVGGLQIWTASQLKICLVRTVVLIRYNMTRCAKHCQRGNSCSNSISSELNIATTWCKEHSTSDHKRIWLSLGFTK